MAHLQFIGGGNIGKALIRGLLSSKKQLAVVVRRAEAQLELKKEFPEVEVRQQPLEGVDAVLAVKPADVAPALATLKDYKIERLISVAAGISIKTLEAGLGGTTKVIRAMPNTPSKIGFGVAGISASSAASDEDLAWAETILGSVGEVVHIKEDLMDAVTGLSGSGTGFVMYFAEALQSAGTELGLDEKSVDILVGHTLLGAAQMLLQDELSAEELRWQVASPNGTTEAGIKALEEGQFAELVKSAVSQAAARAKEIASENE